MKKYNVEYDPHVMKKLSKLDASVRKRIKSWIDKNLEGCENPRVHGKALQGGWEGHWRYRVGDYRIIARIADDRLIIFVVKVDKRSEVYD